MRFGADPVNKKRGLDEFSGTDANMSGSDDEGGVELKMKKVFMKSFKSSENEFLTPGSLSWAMLIGLYLVTLHESTTKSVTFDSMRDMIEVMQGELAKVVQIKATTSELIAQGPAILSKFTEQQLLVELVSVDPFNCPLKLTAKGIKRARDLCTNIGIVIQPEVDLANREKSKILLTVYDKSLMPVIENLYHAPIVKDEAGDIINGSSSGVSPIDQDPD